METLLFFFRISLFAIFGLAGVSKSFHLEGAYKAVKDFGVPKSLVKISAIALLVGELIVAAMLLFVQTSWYAAILALAMLVIFNIGMAIQIWKGNAPDCHCFGQVHSEPVSARSLIRNGIFSIPAIGLILAGRNNQGYDLFNFSNTPANNFENNSMLIVIGLAAVGLLAAAVYFLKQISEQQLQIMRRIEILEFSANDGTKTVEREEVSAPAEGMTIGAIAPDFSLSDLNGKAVSLKNLIQPEKATAMFFVSPSCNPCGALLPDIENWQEQFKEDVNFVFISSGDAKANAEKFAGKTFKKILLQKKNEIAELFGAKWTPTVVLINSDGRIASRALAGDTAIKELFASLENTNGENGKYFIQGKDGASKIGTPLPDFELNDIEGKSVSSKDFSGKPTLLTYWSMNCGFCTRMMEDLRTWDKTKGQDAPNLLVVSSGDAEKHKEMQIDSPVVLDDERKLPESLGMTGTPSAVLIDERGRIISEVAVGADNIWSLVGRKVEKKDETA